MYDKIEKTLEKWVGYCSHNDNFDQATLELNELFELYHTEDCHSNWKHLMEVKDKEIARLHHIIEKADDLVNLKNEEIADLKQQLKEK